MIPWHGLIPYFNPLPRKEGDSEQKIQALSDAVISIHSLVKRETAFRLRSIFCKYHFNPLPRKEGDFCPIVLRLVYNVISIHSLVKRETGQDTAG